MAYLEIPLNGQGAFQDFTITLEGRTYLLGFNWNTRGNFFAMTVSKENSTPIVEGIAMRLGTSFLSKYQSVDLPPGNFFLWDTTGNIVEPARLDYGQSVKLMYVESTT